MDTYKLVVGSVSTPLDHLLQPVRHTLHTLQRTWVLKGLPASLLFFGRDVCFGIAKIFLRPLYLTSDWSLVFNRMESKPSTVQ